VCKTILLTINLEWNTIINGKLTPVWKQVELSGMKAVNIVPTITARVIMAILKEQNLLLQQYVTTSNQIRSKKIE
jgi:hypothetical protein